MLKSIACQLKAIHLEQFWYCLRSKASFSIKGKETYIQVQSPMLTDLNEVFRKKAEIFQAKVNEMRIEKSGKQMEGINEIDGSPQLDLDFSYFQMKLQCLKTQESINSQPDAFSICEIAAYLLAVEINGKRYDSLKDENQIQRNLVEREDWFFKNLESEVSLILEKYKIFLQKSNFKPLLPYHENILKWELTINIRRRFVQIMKFYENGEAFAEGILRKYEVVAEQLINYLSHGELHSYDTLFKSQEQFDNNIFPSLQGALKIIDQICQKTDHDLIEKKGIGKEKENQSKNKIAHRLIGDQFRALFAINTNEELFSPFAASGIQQGFLKSKIQVGKNLQQNENKEIKNYSLSFIPTSVTKILFLEIQEQLPLKLISGYKDTGKSINFMLYATLKNYCLQPKIFFWPEFMNGSFEQVSMSVFESIWMTLKKNEMNEWQKIMKQNGSNENQIKCLLNLLEKSNSKFDESTQIIIDQFSNYLEKVYKEKKKNTDQIGFQQQLFNRLYNKKIKKVLTSSIYLENDFLSKIFFKNYLDSRNSKMIKKVFTKKQASYIIKIWLKKCLHCDLSSMKMQNFVLASALIDLSFQFEKNKPNEVILLRGEMPFLKFLSQKLYSEYIPQIKKGDKMKLEQISLCSEEQKIQIIKQYHDFIQKISIFWYAKEINEWIQKVDLSERQLRYYQIATILECNQLTVKKDEKYFLIPDSLVEIQVLSQTRIIKKLHQHIIPLKELIKEEFFKITGTAFKRLDELILKDKIQKIKHQQLDHKLLQLLRKDWNSAIEKSANKNVYGSCIYDHWHTILASLELTTTTNMHFRQHQMYLFKLQRSYEITDTKALIDSIKLKVGEVTAKAKSNANFLADPLFMYVMPESHQDCFTGMFIKVEQETNNVFNLSISMMDLNLDPNSYKFPLKVFPFFNYFDEGFQIGQLKFSIRSRNCEFLRSLYEIDSNWNCKVLMQMKKKQQIQDKREVGIYMEQQPENKNQIFIRSPYSYFDKELAIAITAQGSSQISRSDTKNSSSSCQGSHAQLPISIQQRKISHFNFLASVEKAYWFKRLRMYF